MADSEAVAAPDPDAGVDGAADAAGDSASDSASGPDAAADAGPAVDSDAQPGADIPSDTALSPPQCQISDDCPALGACLLAVCTPKGKCAAVALADGATCSDGNACSTGDLCAGAGCVASGTLSCDDLNPCTLDKCNPLAGCVNWAIAATTACDDGDACTAADTCVNGSCQSGVNTCQCQANSECGKFEDGNLCNGTLYCDKSTLPYVCKANPATVFTCPTGSDGACQKNTCIPATGQCKLVLAPANTACDDGDKCTTGDFCGDGLCAGGSNTCFCKTTSDCATSEDGNHCNGTLFCNKATAQCQLNPLTVVTCQTVLNTYCAHNTCNPKDGKCVVLPVHDSNPCDDGNACSPNEVCQGGTCSSTTNTCECTKDADCAAKEDANLCNGTLYCDTKLNKCVVNPKTVVACDTDDDLPCLRDVCNGKTGKCEALALPKEGTACDDANGCTAVDVCQSGACVGLANTCDCQKDPDCSTKEDGDSCNGSLYCAKNTGKCEVNPATVVACPAAFDETCLTNQCDKKTGSCGMKPAHQGNQCSDGGNVCSAGGWCALGVCDLGTTNTCACEKDMDCSKFEDGDLCNGVLYCDKTGSAPACKVVPSSTVVCSIASDTVCSKMQCGPSTGKCSSLSITGPCDDGNACTVADGCVVGLCSGGAVQVCDDGDACTTDLCASAVGCLSLPKGATACDDKNICTADSCGAKTGCVHSATTGLCDDGDVCSSGDACSGGQCVGTAVVCADSNECTDDTCVKTKGCVTLPNTASCTDGNACTSGDICGSGACKGPIAVPCDDKNPCTVDTCAPKLGCQTAFAAGSCDDSNACTSQDSCKSGYCQGLATLCDDGNPCTTDSCEPKTGCSAKVNTAACSDGNPCTTGDLCANGACKAGSPPVCEDKNPCTSDGCDPKGGCIHNNNTLPCDDGTVCTDGDVCKAAVCTPQKGLDCDDGNACTIDNCNAKTGCGHANNQGMGCNDNNACTSGDKCNGGQCLGAG